MRFAKRSGTGDRRCTTSTHSPTSSLATTRVGNATLTPSGRFFHSAAMTRQSPVKRRAIQGLGCVLLVIGVLLMVLPDPGIPLVFAGLSILATQFPLAQLWRGRLRRWTRGIS